MIPVPPTLLRFLTYIFLALLYLFFLRVLRAVWIELREPKAAPEGPAPVPAPPPMPAPARAVAAPVAAAAAGTFAGTNGSRDQTLSGHRERVRIVEPGERQGQEFSLADELTVGRAPGCGVPVPEDTFVSQVHARVFRRDGDLWLEDLGSTNGTFLNDQKVSAPMVMRPGDHLKVGRTIFEVVT